MQLKASSASSVGYSFGVDDRIYRALCDILVGLFDIVRVQDFTTEEWNLFGSLAEDQGVAPLIYWKFTQFGCPENIPQVVCDRLANSYYRTAAQNLLIYRELRHIINSLHEAEIQVVVLKGAALAATVYPNIALRPMGDLDLLVHRKDLEKTTELILSLGYKIESSERVSGIGQFINHDISLRNQSDKNLVIELHWRLIAGDADWRSPAVDWFFGQTEKVNAKNIPLSFAILNTPTHLIYLSAHQMLQHGEEQARLCWLYDLHLLICQDGSKIDWRKLFADANRFHWGPVIGFALRKIHKLFGTPLPDDFDILVNDYQDQRTLVLLDRRSYPPESRLTREFRRIQTLNWQARILFVLAIIFPSPSHIKRHYHPKPSWLWPLFYFYRWLDILFDSLFNFPKIILECFRKREI